MYNQDLSKISKKKINFLMEKTKFIWLYGRN